VSLLVLIIDGYSLVVFVAVILSWVQLSSDHPLLRITNTLTEPVLGRLRRVLPAFGGFDLSPMLLLFALRMVRRVLLSA
jgi:YggT family protein